MGCAPRPSPSPILVAGLTLAALLSSLPAPAAADAPAPFPAPGDRFAWKSSGADHTRDETETWVTAARAAEIDARLASRVADGLVGRVREGSRETTNAGAYWTRETWREVALVRASDRQKLAEGVLRSTTLRGGGATVETNEVTTYTDCQQQRWPLAVGDEWKTTCKGEGTTSTGGKYTTESPSTWKVAAQETVGIPGRSFTVFKIERYYGDGSLGETSWFSPAACSAVKHVQPFAPGADFNDVLQEGGCAATSFAYTMPPPNRPPTISCTFVRGVRGAFVSWTATDPDGDEVNVTIRSNGPDGNYVSPLLPATGRDHVIPNRDASASADDKKGGEAIATCPERTNLPPSVTCSVARSDEGLILTWTAVDPEGDPVDTRAAQEHRIPIAGGRFHLPPEWDPSNVKVYAADPYHDWAPANCAEGADTHTLRVEITSPQDGDVIDPADASIEWELHDVINDIDLSECKAERLIVSVVGTQIAEEVFNQDYGGGFGGPRTCGIGNLPENVRAIVVTVSASHIISPATLKDSITIYLAPRCEAAPCPPPCPPAAAEACATTLPPPTGDLVPDGLLSVDLFGDGRIEGAIGCTLGAELDDGTIVGKADVECHGSTPWRIPGDFPSNALQLVLEGEIDGHPFRTESDKLTLTNTAPRVVIHAPTADQRFRADAPNFRLDYAVTDAEDNVVSKKAYSSNDGTTYGIVDLAADDAGGFRISLWQPAFAGGAAGQWFVKVEAVDAGGLKGSDLVRIVIEAASFDEKGNISVPAIPLAGALAALGVAAHAGYVRRR